VRTRVLLTRIEDWEAVARVRGEYFHDIRPVDTIMQVTRFVDPGWLIEMEADAVIAHDTV
jgi:enamine deaminase RidA (YjgF/YER057c/UK114 family)